MFRILYNMNPGGLQSSLHPPACSHNTAGEIIMALKIFDIDGTILRGDSNDQFFKCLIDHKIITPDYMDFNREAGARFYSGTLDILEYYRYVIKPIAGKTEAELKDLLDDYRENYLKPHVYPKAQELISRFRNEGHVIILASATMDLLVKQTAELVGADFFISTRVKYDEEGRIRDVYPDFCHQEGKRARLKALCQEKGLNLKDSSGYGDTINDIPLLETVDHAFVANPSVHSEKLLHIAAERKWQTIRF